MVSVVPLAYLTLDPSAKQRSDLLAVIGLTVFLSVPAIFGAWDTIHCRIIADERGMTFHDFFKSYFVSWREIEDYQLRARSAVSSSRPFEAFVLAQGQWRELPYGYVGHEALLAKVAREAKWSQSHEWQRALLSDDGDWPKTFEYKDISGWKIAAIPLLIFLSLCGLLWGGDLLPLLLVFYGPIALICGAVYFQVKGRRPFLGRKIVASPEGLLYLRDDEETEIGWDEIESYYMETLPGHFQPSLFVIESRGRRIEFAGGIEGIPKLLGLVRDRATNAATKEWDFLYGANEDVLGGAESFWKDGQIGVGPKIHHYRSRIWRLYLWLGIGMAGTFAVMVGVAHSDLAPRHSASDAWTLLIVGAFLALVCCNGWLAFQYSSLQAEENGLRKNCFWGEQFLPWSEVEALKRSFLGYKVLGRSTQIGFTLLISDLKGLRHEIEERSGHMCIADGKAK